MLLGSPHQLRNAGSLTLSVDGVALEFQSKLKKNLLMLQSFGILFGILFGKRSPGGGVWKNGWNAFVCVSLRLESRSRKALKKQYLFRGSVRFQLKSKRLYGIHVTWFGWFLCRECDSAPH